MDAVCSFSSRSGHVTAGISTMSPRQVSALIPMKQLLVLLGFTTNERTRRCACILHGGSNCSAFAWTATGLWKCHSCGAGGDRIALVQAVRNCGFREALEFLGHLADVQYLPRRASRREIERARMSRERAQDAAWRVRDEVLRLRSYYRDGLHRTERLMARTGEVVLQSRTQAEQDAAWESMARLAPAQTFFSVACGFLCRASGSALVRFALASAEQRRALIFGDDDANTQRQAT
jgi:CHC2 zinc finger